MHEEERRKENNDKIKIYKHKTHEKWKVVGKNAS